MNAIYGWPSEIRPGMPRPAGQVPGPASVPVASATLGANQVPPAMYDPDLVASQFLGRAGFSCAIWERLSLSQKRDEVYYFLHARQTKREAGANVQGYTLKRGVNNFGPTDTFIHAVDAHCLKLAFNSVHAAKSFQISQVVPSVYSIVPAGQAAAPAGMPPMAAGLLGFAVGGIVTFLVMR